MAAGSPSLHDLKSLSARLLAAGESKPAAKFDNIKAALEARDDETLTRLVNQRCVQLRAIGMAKESKLDLAGLAKFKRGGDIFKWSEKLFMKVSLCSGGGGGASSNNGCGSSTSSISASSSPWRSKRELR
jgi:hypothetical protein